MTIRQMIDALEGLARERGDTTEVQVADAYRGEPYPITEIKFVEHRSEIWIC